MTHVVVEVVRKGWARRSCGVGALGLFLWVGTGSAWCDESSPTASDQKTVVFGGVESGGSTFASVGFKRTLSGPLDRDGPAILATAGYGAYFERQQPSPARATLQQTVLAGALAGYQWMLPWGAVGAFAGPEMSFHSAAERTPGEARGFNRARFGARVQGEIWAHPTTDTLLTTTVILGSAERDLWSRVALGYRLRSELFVGPEASAYVTETYRKQQLGLHVTGVEAFGVNFRLSGGWQRERDRPGSPYVGLSGYFKL